MNKFLNTPDNELIIGYKKSNNRELLGVLFKRYSGMVLGVCIKHVKDTDLAEDLTMQVFEFLLNKVHQYEISNFKSWLFVISKNTCLMYLRKKKVEINEQWLGENASVIMEKHAQLHLNNNEEEKESKIEELLEGINKLSPEQKWCVELFYLKEKSYKEIEQITGYSYNDVKSYIQNGKRNLKNLIQKES